MTEPARFTIRMIGHSLKKVAVSLKKATRNPKGDDFTERVMSGVELAVRHGVDRVSDCGAEEDLEVVEAQLRRGTPRPGGGGAAA